MRTFRLYRHGTATMEGVVWSDGKVACRWLIPPTGGKTWDSYADFYAVQVAQHEPGYGAAIVWQGIGIVDEGGSLTTDDRP